MSFHAYAAQYNTHSPGMNQYAWYLLEELMFWYQTQSVI